MRYKIIVLILFLLSVTVGRGETEAPYLFVKNYTIEEYKASCQNWALSLSSEGILYVANNSGLLSFNGNTWTLYPMPDKEEIKGVTYYDNKIYTLSPSGIGIWSEDDKGLMHYELIKEIPNEVKFKAPPIHIPFEIPKEIIKEDISATETNGEYFFIGTLKNGLYILDSTGNILTNLSLGNRLQDNIVRAITMQDPTEIWLALDNGLTQISINPPLVMLEKRSIIGKLENATIHNNELYIETNQGLFSRSLKENIPFKEIKDEEFSFPDFASKDLNVRDLFSTYESLGKFAEATEVYMVSSHLYWLVLDNEAALFHEENGIGTLVCRILFDNYNINLVTRGRKLFPLDDNITLVSAMQGCFLLNNRELIDNSISPTAIKSPLQFSRLEYTGTDGKHFLMVNENKISLPHDYKAFTACVATTIFTSNHQISYMIEGVSDDWSPWQQEGSISFLQLPEGEYLLKVRKYVIKGPFPEISRTIKVEAPWYNTVWAWLFYIITGWLLAILVLKYNLQNIHKEEQRKIEEEQQKEQQRLQEIKQQVLETEIQKKNNELTLQTSTLVKRNQSIQILIEELDKQKEALGDRYPNKLYNRMKALMEETFDNSADWIQFESYFNSAHQNFIDRLRQQYPDLTTGDLRICCLLRMNLSTKEIASLLNISVRAIELRRYRMRKRMELEGDTNLVDFLMNF